MRSFIFLLALCAFPQQAWGKPTPVYDKAPGVVEFIPNVFSDIPYFLRDIDPRDHWRTYLWLSGLTAALIVVDQPLLDASQRFAHHIGLISHNDNGANTYTMFNLRLFKQELPVQAPKGLNASFYYIGDGLTSISIVAGLTAYGAYATNYRALHTASQVMEAIILAGIFGLVVKTSTGRESPFRATKRGGEWRFFPGYKTYLSDPSKHDAYPSGHMATVMAALRVLGENYHEKSWIYPLGYSAMGLLGFGMLNNGVHWASDYPLGIAIGYVAAGVVLQRRADPYRPAPAGKVSWRGFFPYYGEEGTGLMASWVF
jgi:hypothetical protein